MGKSIDVTLIAPILLDPQRGWVDLAAGTAAVLAPAAIALVSINLIYVRFSDLLTTLPYAQAASFYHSLYLLSVSIMLFGLARGGYSSGSSGAVIAIDRDRALASN